MFVFVLTLMLLFHFSTANTLWLYQRKQAFNLKWTAARCNDFTPKHGATTTQGRSSTKSVEHITKPLEEKSWFPESSPNLQLTKCLHLPQHDAKRPHVPLVAVVVVLEVLWGVPAQGYTLLHNLHMMEKVISPKLKGDIFKVCETVSEGQF